MNKTLLPPRLKKGKCVAVIAPADPVKGVCAEADIKRGEQFFKGKGFEVVAGKSTQTAALGHTAGTIQDIVNEIHEFVERPDVGCIMGFWGGLNTNRILEALNYKLIKSHPKIFVGFSDITALTTAITTKTGMVTFSGPSFVSFTKPDFFEYTWEYFERLCVFAENNVEVIAANEYADDHYFLRKDNNRRILKKNSGICVFRTGSAEGQVVAGNLQTLLALSGTEYFEGVEDKVIFVEEGEETSPAHLDRFFRQCKQLGWFEKVRGVVIGRFTEQSCFTPEDSLEALLAEYFSNATFPVLYNVDFGHSDPLITIPHGGRTRLDGNRSAISFSQSVI